MVIKPDYKEDEKKTKITEINIPSFKDYLELGFKSKIRDTKHYRLYIDKELENSQFMGEDSYLTLDVTRGRRLPMKKRSFLDRLLSNEETHRVTG